MAWVDVTVDTPVKSGKYMACTKSTSRVYTLAGDAKFERCQVIPMDVWVDELGIRIEVNGFQMSNTWVVNVDEDNRFEVTHWRRYANLPDSVAQNAAEFGSLTEARKYAETMNLKGYKLEVLDDNKARVEWTW